MLTRRPHRVLGRGYYNHTNAISKFLYDGAEGVLPHKADPPEFTVSCAVVLILLCGDLLKFEPLLAATPTHSLHFYEHMGRIKIQVMPGANCKEIRSSYLLHVRTTSGLWLATCFIVTLPYA